MDFKAVFAVVAVFLVVAPQASVRAEPGADGDYTFDEADISGANKLLFGTNHFESITEPVQLVYGFKKSGTLGKGFDDEITINIKKVLPSGRKNVSFRFLSGRNKIRFPSANGINLNFIFQAFLENDVRQMQRQTGGNALFFRNRVRHALAGNSQVVDTTFEFDGKTYEGKNIIVKPFSKESVAIVKGSEKLYSRFSKYADKTYIFTMSHQIPGGFFQISAITPSADGGEPLTSEVMTFLGVKVRKK
ncbi:MAG: hypothetical protein ISR48_07260 [Alphaproteobacteria bacterium]|nr:hypothetical protein [Alphaproteobacteria bacterium]